MHGMVRFKKKKYSERKKPEIGEKEKSREFLSFIIYYGLFTQKNKNKGKRQKK